MNKKKLGIIIVVVLALAIFVKAELTYNSSLRILASVVDFSESTLNNQNYLAYNIDLKDLFRNYANADIGYTGSAYIKKLEGFPYSISGTIKGERSASQKKFSCKSDLDVLVMDVGQMEVYAEDQTIYLVAPMMGNISYGFDTGNDLFLTAPNLNNDINRAWFHDNKTNIFNFVRNIKIDKSGAKYIDEDGTECDEFNITIPKGQGDFIWKLLGMETPDHDIKCSLYLDSNNHTRKITFDLSHQTKGAYISVYGKDLSTIEIYSPLPDSEQVRVTITRNGETNYTNSFSDNVTYTTSVGKIYTLDCNVLLNYVDDGIKAEVSDFTINENEKTLAEGYLKGKLSKKENMGDVFENAKVDLSNVTVIDWNTIKNDTASFIDDVISQARDNVSIFNFFE